MRTYDDLAEELEGTSNHARADELLTAALSLAALTQVAPTPEQSNRIIAAHDNVRLELQDTLTGHQPVGYYHGTTRNGTP